jgi:hypothetical protein
MRVRALLAAAVLAAAPAPSAGEGYASLLDPLLPAVIQKEAELGVAIGRPTAAHRAVRRARRILEERPRLSLADDLRRGSEVAGVLDRRFPADPLLDPVLADCFGDLRYDAVAERAALVAWMGLTGSDRGERILDRGIYAATLRMQRGDGAATREAAARHWGRAVAGIRRTRERLGLATPEAAPPPFQGLAPDFLLADANPGSATSGQDVSPRDHLGKVTAWYFVAAT